LSCKIGEKNSDRGLLATQRLKEAFSGVKNVWLVDDRLIGLKGEAARDLLTACGTLDVLRVVPVEGSLSREERTELRVKLGANTITWDRIEGDATCSELEALLEAFSSLPPELAKSRAAAFWMLLRDTLRDRRDSYFQGRYIWGYGQRLWQTIFPATWVRVLRNARWIPDSSGKLFSPLEIYFSEVSEEIRNNGHPFLTEILGFRPEAIKELAAKEGIDLETLNLLKRHKVSAEQLRKFLGETEGQADDDEKDAEADDSSEDDQKEDDSDEREEGQNGENQEDDEKEENGGSGEGGGQGEHGGNGGGRAGGGSGKRKEGSAQGKQFHTYVSVNTDSNPMDDEGLSVEDLRATESAAIDFIIGLEPQLERTPSNNPGFDLYEGESLEFVARYVEVKSKKGAWSGAVALSEEQFRLAEIERERFWLYVVEYAQDQAQRRLHKIQDPAGKSKYFTFDSGWKSVAAESRPNGERRVRE
jgi:hypothetical protein